MSIIVEEAGQHTKEIFANLMQFYIYEFSSYLEFDVDENTGLFAQYPEYDKYWNQDGEHIPYFIKSDRNIAGFAMVQVLNGRRNADYYMTEFFIMKKYRKQGIGKESASQLFHKYRGRWLVSQISSNLPAQLFWRKTIGQYTQGNYEEESSLNHRQISQRFSSLI